MNRTIVLRLYGAENSQSTYAIGTFAIQCVAM